MPTSSSIIFAAIIVTLASTGCFEVEIDPRRVDLENVAKVSPTNVFSFPARILEIERVDFANKSISHPDIIKTKILGNPPRGQKQTKVEITAPSHRIDHLTNGAIINLLFGPDAEFVGIREVPNGEMKIVPPAPPR